MPCHLQKSMTLNKIHIRCCFGYMCTEYKSLLHSILLPEWVSSWTKWWEDEEIKFKDRCSFWSEGPIHFPCKILLYTWMAVVKRVLYFNESKRKVPPTQTDNKILLIGKMSLNADFISRKLWPQSKGQPYLSTINDRNL